MLLIKNGIA